MAAIEQASARPGAGRARRGSIPTLVPVRRTGTRLPIFCICAGHGDMLAVAKLGQLLGPDQPYYCLQAPLDVDANGSQSALLDRLMAEYSRRITAVAPDGPIVLGGNSCGGLIAFELAKRLQAQGRRVDSVVLLDTPFKITQLNYQLHRLVIWATRALAPQENPKAARRVRFVRTMLSDNGLDVHVRATRGYVPSAYSGRVILYMARFWYLGGLFAGGLYVAPRRWQSVVGNGFAVEPIDGNHVSFMREPHVETLAAHLRGALAERTGVPA